jgi:hypothetical protein
MAVLVTAIHVLSKSKNVDARHKAGHDELTPVAATSTQHRLAAFDHGDVARFHLGLE